MRFFSLGPVFNRIIRDECGTGLNESCDNGAVILVVVVVVVALVELVVVAAVVGVVVVPTTASRCEDAPLRTGDGAAALERARH
jgi:hypothetical protein